VAAARVVSDLPGYLAYRLASGLIGLLPESAVRHLGVAAGRLWFRFGGDKREVVRRNLVRVVGEEAATDDAVRKMFEWYGRYWAEVFWVRERRRDQILAHSTVHNADRIHEAAAAGNGVVLALPHLGNWEMAGAAAEAIGVPVLAAAEALSNRRIVDWFVSTRNALGIEVVLVGGDRSTTVRLLARLRDGGAIALVSDRDLSGRGVEVEFFGERTTLPAGPAAFADRTGAALLPVGCYFRKGRGHDFVVAAPIDVPDLPEREERIAVATQRYAHALEGLIRRAPEQWHMFQPNWPADREAAAEKVAP
jgi:lauroyl/myristoyl acyltransferase